MVVVVVVVVVGGGVVVVVALVVVDVVGIGVVVLVVVVGFAVVVVVVVVDVVDVVEVVDELNLRVGRTLPVVVVVGKLTVCKTGLSCSHRYDPGTLTHFSANVQLCPEVRHSSMSTHGPRPSATSG